MARDLQDTVNRHVQRIEQIRLDVSRLSSERTELEAKLSDPDLPRAERKPAQTLLKSTNAKLEKAKSEQAAEQHRYAAFRIANCLGLDEAYIDEIEFNKALNEISSVGGGTTIPEDTPLSFATARNMMLANKVVAEVVAELVESGTDDMARLLDQKASTKVFLRDWAEAVAKDDYVAAKIKEATALARQFETSLQKLDNCVNNLRVNYERANDSVDTVKLGKDRNGDCVTASIYWENLLAAFPRDVRMVYARFYAAEEIAARVKRIRGELNCDIATFVAHVVPCYFNYVARLQPDRRTQILGRRSVKRKLVASLASEAERTDYLLDESDGLKFPVLKTPKDYRPIRKFDSYKEFRRAVERRLMQDATTAEMPPHARPEDASD